MSTSPHSIASPTTAMAAGEAGAIERFYRAYSPVMLGMIRVAVASRCRDEAFCLDVLHDVTLRIIRCIKPIQTEPHLLNWTRLVVQSCALDRLRRERRLRQREQIHSRAEAVDLRAPDEEEIAWLASEVAALDPTLAHLLRLRFAEGWTLARIASAYRTSTGRIDGQLRRAIERLRVRAKAVFDE